MSMEEHLRKGDPLSHWNAVSLLKERDFLVGESGLLNWMRAFARIIDIYDEAVKRESVPPEEGGNDSDTFVADAMVHALNNARENVTNEVVRCLEATGLGLVMTKTRAEVDRENE